MLFYNYFNNIVSVSKNDKRIKYKIILPGIEKEDVDINLSANELTIKTKTETAFNEKFYYRDAYNYDKEYKVSEAKSTLKNGVLTIIIPAKEKKEEKVYTLAIE